MGLRYRKSINLGGGFRINLSKSGVGYSWGGKGFRFTKTATGRNRTTASIPGTGISYVSESGKKKSKQTHHNTTTQQHQSGANIVTNSNYYDTKEIINADASKLASDGLEAMLKQASDMVMYDAITTLGLIVSLFLGPLNLVFLTLFIVLKIIVRTKGVIDLDYSIDSQCQLDVASKMDPIIAATQCKKVWRVTQSNKVKDRKHNAGAGENIKRDNCKCSSFMPFPFKANIKVATFDSGSEKIVFLPDMILIMQGTKIGALKYEDIESASYSTRFIEDKSVPADSEIVKYTWKYVNKSGGPDKRFKDNKQLPVCMYGILEMVSESGLNTIFMLSNPNAAKAIYLNSKHQTR